MLGCPRPPSRAQAKIRAHVAPYDHWTVWSAQDLALDRGKPSYDVVRRAFGSLLEYDSLAVEKVIDYMDMSTDDRIAAARSLCAISSSKCHTLA